ncbi:ferredoxin [Rhodococcus sp. BP-252]|uniref:Ferredoxin n=1 Tax=Rhodococcoides kyotonense TaxID=398843 RepID=A0A177YGN5_9NOCA|nr:MULTISPECIES: ferredoxin [Rhodococcus]MBY6414693.1 ferredoxin [Rhodococcus sp. BP-320]MBY6419597.1 ferredoxin [Rhodococcus sp. BP-321]MBY6424569.1 ferredoxin [Rhodococcus sp. BP-324]MBY6429566.1 ferredoxin [Rhodococcus sp. BP-323]MBY6434538.1 ferredoxin [Rhodococcus sp. BP-322]
MVEVDRDLCEANGVCVGLVPEVFDLDDDDELSISGASERPELRKVIDVAIASCPRAALGWGA